MTGLEINISSKRMWKFLFIARTAIPFLTILYLWNLSRQRNKFKTIFDNLPKVWIYLQYAKYWNASFNTVYSEKFLIWCRLNYVNLERCYCINNDWQQCSIFWFRWKNITRRCSRQGIPKKVSYLGQQNQ